MNKMNELVLADDSSRNWLLDKYYYAGSNSRYWTFQIALNILAQKTEQALIVETGCQRQKDDLGAGMSTSIFGEYAVRYNGQLITVDLIAGNLNVCKDCTKEWSSNIQYILSDSVEWLANHNTGPVDLLYLDSYDHPYGELLNLYGGQQDIHVAIKTVSTMTQQEILEKHSDLITPCQEHCLQELKAAEDSGKVVDTTVVLIDDNQLPGGGKSRLAKSYLASRGWTCLFDLQQTLWVKRI
jgi:hypothetical protein